MEIEKILDTYMNGNPDDMREQIRKYGVRKFFYDLLTHMMYEQDELNASNELLRYRRIYGIYYGFRS